MGQVIGEIENLREGKGMIKNNWLSRLWLSVALSLLAMPVFSLDAEAVFKTSGPGVVLIKDLEGFGSGVVLTSDGLIVTCYHVVNTPLKQTVVAEVKKNGQRVKQEFTDVKLVSVHPKYDLALIQVKTLSGVSFIVPPKSTGRRLSTGEDCFVIGNPSGAAGKVLENSISKGIVGTAEREVDGASYIQVTAQINPGNSGGALCDKNGQLVGIVTFKVGEAEGLGFAIPVAKINKAEFVQPKEKKGNIEQCKKYEQAGARWFNIARQSIGERREEALYLAYVCYRLSLAEFPNAASPYHNVGLMYYEMKSYEAAQAFFEKAIELSPDLPNTRQLLGIIANIWLKDKERSDRHFLAGIQTKLTDVSSVQGQAACIQNYGINMIEDKRYAEAAYCCKWSMTLRTDNSQQENLQNNLRVASENISDKQFAEISDKKEGFSLADMKRFAQNRSTGKSLVSADKGTKPAALTPVVPVPSAAASGNVSLAKLYEKMLTGAPKLEASGLRKALPEAPLDIRPAMGGAYILMHFPAMGKLGVFNVAQAKFDTYLPVPENALFTAGGVTLLVYLPTDRVFQMYDLRTLQRTSSKPSRIIGIITDIEMGLFNSEAAMISYADSTEALSTRHYGVLNLGTFQTLEFKGDMFHNRCYRDNIHLRVDENFTGFVSWATSHSPSGFIFGPLTSRGIKEVCYEHSDFGSLALDKQCQRVYSSHRGILNLKGEVVKDFSGASLFPVQGGCYFLEVRKTQVTVREPLGYSEVSHIELPFEFATTSWSKNNLTDDRLLYGCAPLNRACFIDLKGLALYTFELGLGENVQQVRQSLEGVASGTLWTSKMNFPAGTKVNVEDAPPGVKYDVATTTLSWPIPASQPSGSVTVLLSVTLPGKEEAYQRVVVPVR